jgi:predicted nucleic acid-binding protein
VTLIADSGALYALYDADDRHHEAVKRALAAARGPIIVPTALLAEVDYLLREFLGVDAELDFLASIADGAFVLEHFLPPDLVRARELIEQYRGLDLGLTDATVVATAERLHVPTILTVDERDFRAVRHRSGASFVLWPADLDAGT